MQLGTRWTSGDEPPAAVPAVLRPQIAAVDRAMPRDDLGPVSYTHLTLPTNREV